MTRLAVDVGQTGLRLRWASGEHAVASGGSHLAAPGAVEGLVENVAAAVSEAGLFDVERVLLGITGWPGAEAGRQAARAVAQRIRASSVFAASDSVTGYLGALGPEPGVVLTAGTGVVAVGARPGAIRLVGGLGWAVDDEGGGFWIGRQGLLHAARAADGRAPMTGLLTAATAEFGPPDGWPARVYATATPVPVVAAFARQVAALAADGDEQAMEILREAADRLAEVARAAADHRPPIVVVTGAIVTAGSVLTAPLGRAFVRCGLPAPQPPRGSPLEGADQLDTPPARRLFGDHIVAWETSWRSR